MVVTAHDVRELIAKAIVRDQGGSLMRWRSVLGRVRIYPLDTHPHCNWRIDPAGTIAEVEAAERAIDVVSARHPIVR
jgi:hypothetical protein